MIPSSNWTDDDLVGIMKSFADSEGQLSILTSNFKGQSLVEHNRFTDVLKGITDISKVTSALADKISYSNRCWRPLRSTGSRRQIDPLPMNCGNDDKINYGRGLVTTMDDSDDGNRPFRGVVGPQGSSNAPWGLTGRATAEVVLLLEDFSMVVSKHRKRTFSDHLRTVCDNTLAPVIPVVINNAPQKNVIRQ